MNLFFRTYEKNEELPRFQTTINFQGKKSYLFRSMYGWVDRIPVIDGMRLRY